MSRISTVLFDADGVIQQFVPDWQMHWGSLIDAPERLSEFMQDIFAAERPHLVSTGGLPDAIQQVLDRWGSRTSIDDALALWNLIEPSPDMFDVVRAVRQAGLSVCLATNQHQYRFEYMVSRLGYGAEFDHLFPSCELGVAKPSAVYFNRLVERLGCEPGEMLFIDDSEANVRSAQAVGLHGEVFHLRDGAAVLRANLAKYGVLI